MNLTPIDSIHILENRQRREFDEARLSELASSIRSKGLFHPPVVRAADSGYVLVAGERRLRAIQSIYTAGDTISYGGERLDLGQVPVTLISELTPFEIEEAELEENTIRVDLSWQERAAAIARLHALRSAQAAQRGESQSVSDTAAEIMGHQPAGSSHASINEAIILANHLADPDVAAAKSQKEAVKVVRKKLEQQKREALAQQFNPQSTPHVVVQGDFRDRVKELPDETFDVIITDPPYGVDADSFGDQAGTGHDYADTEDYARELIDTLAVESFRVTRSKAHLYMFLDLKLWEYASLQFSLAGWYVWYRPLVWAKSNGMLPRPEHGPRNTYELILYAIKGDRKVQRVAPDTIIIPSVANPVHGAEKPVALYADLLSRSAYPGDKVLDPFCGSGPVFAAADQCKCVATGIELSPKYHAISVERIAKGSADAAESEDLLDLGV